MRFGSSASASTKKAASVSRAKPPWRSATKKWRIKKTLRTPKRWPMRPKKNSRNRINRASTAKVVAAAAAVDVIVAETDAAAVVAVAVVVVVDVAAVADPGAVKSSG